MILVFVILILILFSVLNGLDHLDVNHSIGIIFERIMTKEHFDILQVTQLFHGIKRSWRLEFLISIMKISVISS